MKANKNNPNKTHLIVNKFKNQFLTLTRNNKIIMLERLKNNFPKLPESDKPTAKEVIKWCTEILNNN